MLAQAARVTLLILSFRAGPQDFPFSPQLLRVIVPLTVAVSFLQYRYTLNNAQAGAEALVSVLVILAFAQVLLQMRGLSSRFQQTCGALLATSATITLAALPALALVAPAVLEYSKNPDSGVIRAPVLPLLYMALLSFWNLAVTAHILRHALQVRPWPAIGLALLLSLMMFTIATGVGATLADPVAAP